MRHMTGIVPRIPVARPALPRAEAVLPYLRQIDATRTYSNHGPLVAEFERRIGDRLGLGERQALACASGTMALVGAIMAVRGRHPDKSLCLLPGYCFVAAAAAAGTCGYACHLVDVDPVNWALDPVALRDHPLLDRAGLVLVVAPYGRLPDLAAWELFSRETGVPVVVDAAASLDLFLESGIELPGSVPVALSLHATKSFGCGEGGLMLLGDRALAEDAFRSLNFGYLDTRVAMCPGLNGKMSEYHAAVAHAELDGFEEKRGNWRRVGDSYRAAFGHAEADRPWRLWSTPELSGSYVLCDGGTPDETTRLRNRLVEHGIETRFWYSGGIGGEPAYRDLASDPLHNTETLSARLLGMPCFVDLPDEDIGAIVAALT